MIATALAGLLPARLQKASLDEDALLLEFYSAPKKWWLEVRAGAVSLADARPARGEVTRTPPAVQGLVRKELVPALLVEVTGDHVVRLAFTRMDDKKRVIAVERVAGDPRAVLLALTEDGARVLAVLLGGARAKDGRDLRRGQIYTEPVAGALVVEKARPAALLDPLQEMRARVRAETKRVEKLVRALEGDLVKHGDPARHEQDGELLKTVLSALKRGSASVEVVDYDGNARVIALDVKLDAKRNLEKLFARAKKARTAIARTTPRLAEARAQLAALRDAATGDDVARMNAALGSGRAQVSARRAIAKAGKRQPWRAFRVTDDVVVRVGRGAKDNDLLVKSARGHDVWLHARERAGGHVIVPSRGDEVADAVMLDAAHLAAHFSSARGEARVDVQHTRVKNLRKPPGAAPGLFLVGHEAVLHLRVDEARVQALLAREVPG